MGSYFFVLLSFAFILYGCYAQISIKYCVYSEGSRCSPNITISNSKFRVGNTNESLLRLEPSRRHGLNLTCSSFAPMKWILDVPMYIQIDSSGAIVTDFGMEGDLFTGRSFQLQLSLRLGGLNGAIRCQSYTEEDFYAEIYLDTSGKTLNFLGQREVVNFYIPKKNAPPSVPCTVSGPSSSQVGVKLFQTSQENKILNGVSDSCLRCICRPTGCLFQTQCHPLSYICGPFLISQPYWEDGGEIKPENSSLRHGVHKVTTVMMTVVTTEPLIRATSLDILIHCEGPDWQACAGDYNCAAETVRRYMARYRRDCNGDGVLTCEDMILIHHAGPSRCSETSSFLDLHKKRHRPCIDTISEGEDITDTATYDPRIGFLLASSLNFSALYVCSTSSRNQQVSYAPLDPDNELPSSVQYKPNPKQYSGGSIICEVPGNHGLEINIVPCLSLHDCDLKIRPSLGLGKFVVDERVVKFVRKAGGYVYASPTTTEGMVGCFRIAENEVSTPHFVRHIDYFFTGLDSIVYLTSTTIPTKAMIHLFTKATTFERGTRQTFSCRVSTFLTLPIIQFAIILTDGQMLLLHSSENEGNIEDAKIQSEITGTFQKDATAERLVHITLETNMKEVLCLVPWINSSGWLNQSFSLHVTPPGVAWRRVGAIAGSASALLLISIASISFVWMKYRDVKRRLRNLTEGEVEEFYRGDRSSDGIEHDVADPDHMAFPEKYRLPPDAFTLYHKELLGEGQFGRCYKGCMQGRPVAVKMIKSSADVENFKAFLKELKVMAYIERHENVVEFIGAMVERISERVCLVLTELSPYGDLQRFLQTNSTNFKEHAVSRTEPLSTELNLFSTDLISFCAQISAGMEYLAYKKVIHGDLAARNILVFDNMLVKITDFGLSRKLYNSIHYTKKNQAPLPWRWMALETLKYLQFSIASDVWAFGVTAWEIFTLGQIPFAGLTWSQDFAMKLENGYRLSKPSYASDDTYKFLIKCWSNQPSERPSFTQVKEYFQRSAIATDYYQITPNE